MGAQTLTMHALKGYRGNRAKDFPSCPWGAHRIGRKVSEYLKAWDGGVAAVGLEGLHFCDLQRTARRYNGGSEVLRSS